MVYSLFSHQSDTIVDKRLLEEGGLCFRSCLRVTRKALWQKDEVPGDIVSVISKQRKVNAGVQVVFFFLLSPGSRPC